MSVTFHYADVSSVSIKGKKKLRLFVAKLFRLEKVSLNQLSYVFCSDEYLLQINRDFLQHDYYTDIITFDLSGGERDVSGEIYISVDRVRDNAKGLGVPFSEELLRVVFHGALHLCGYKDKTKREITVMREKEAHYLRLFGIEPR